jgi:hypothetical protein
MLCVIALVFICDRAVADQITPGNGGNTLIAAGPNHLTVAETIAKRDDGRWEYTYSFTSDEPDDIWGFFVYFPFPAFVSSSTFPNDFGGYPLDAVDAPYDARNVDPTLTSVLSMWYLPLGGPDGLPMGESASFVIYSDYLSTDDKLFGYETVVSGHAGTGIGPAGSLGQVAAIGYTTHVPEPGTLRLLMVAALVVFGGTRQVR